MTGARKVVMVCSETYRARYEGTAARTGAGRGVAWEGQIIAAELYRSYGRNDRFVPVLFAGAPRDKVVPVELSGQTVHEIDPAWLGSRDVRRNAEGWNRLLRAIHEQPEVAAEPVGERLTQPDTAPTPPSAPPAEPRSEGLTPVEGRTAQRQLGDLLDELRDQLTNSPPGDERRTAQLLALKERLESDQRRLRRAHGVIFVAPVVVCLAAACLAWTAAWATAVPVLCAPTSTTHPVVLVELEDDDLPAFLARAARAKVSGLHVDASWGALSEAARAAVQAAQREGLKTTVQFSDDCPEGVCSDGTPPDPVRLRRFPYAAPPDGVAAWHCDRGRAPTAPFALAAASTDTSDPCVDLHHHLLGLASAEIPRLPAEGTPSAGALVIIELHASTSPTPQLRLTPWCSGDPRPLTHGAVLAQATVAAWSWLHQRTSP